MSRDIAALRAEYAEWKAQRTNITVSQRVLDVFRSKPLTARQAYEALGIGNHCGSRLLANAITNLCLDGNLRADDSRPRRYRFVRDSSQPLPVAVRTQIKAEAKARSDALRALSHKRRIQAAKDAELRKARRRGIGIDIALKQSGSTPRPPHLCTGATETVEQYLARGGQIETLPHNFDSPRTAFPGRRPVYSPSSQGQP